eukprot:CAMPEP_0170620830 /NCGR_PEP_ID=MMETSP0224-20130122/28272_1 /TAXON_ID=285029 /ORGANISM="Togula jolla, Strain CCCM 725" /LENGTH=124 /DNA_ID=CAMNT_0010947039 /DNA_START=123 /DNA_END=494 /DNA_ORIENTATION=-
MLITGGSCTVAARAASPSSELDVIQLRNAVHQTGERGANHEDRKCDDEDTEKHFGLIPRHDVSGHVRDVGKHPMETEHILEGRGVVGRSFIDPVGPARVLAMRAEEEEEACKYMHGREDKHEDP